MNSKLTNVLVRHSVCVGLITAVLTGCVVPGPKEPSSEENVLVQPEDVPRYLREGDGALKRGEVNEALVQYVLALEAAPENADIYYRIGRAHQFQGDVKLAETSYKEALAKSPDHIPSRLGIGLINLRRDNHAYAETVFSAVLELDSRNWVAMDSLAVLHDLRQDFTGAREYYERALTIVPGSAQIMNNLGYSYYLEGDWDNAKKSFQKVVDLHPDFYQGWSNLALTYLQTGEDDLAKSAFERVVSEHKALNNIGYFELLKNRRDKARKTFELAMKTAPQYYPLAQRNIDSLDASSSAVSLKIQRDSDNQRDIDSKQSASDNLKSAKVENSVDEKINKSDLLQSDSLSTDNDDFSDLPAISSDEDAIALVQEHLTTLGFDVGKVDGKLGPVTTDAIEQFQQETDLPVDGNVSESLISQLEAAVR